MQTKRNRRRPFGGLVKEAASRDIGRTVAYELDKRGLIETFRIGRRRYVYLDSIETLGERLSESEAVA